MTSDAAMSVLAEEIPCGGCGYNLRGLRLDGRCPECGVPVSDSMHRGLLRYSQPKYLWALHRATGWKIWSNSLVIAGYLLTWGLWALLRQFKQQLEMSRQIAFYWARTDAA